MPIDKSVAIRIVQPIDIPALTECFNATFGAVRKPSIFEWKYGGSPWRAQQPLGVGAFLGEKMIAFYGAIPWRLVLPDGNIIDVVQPADVGVRPGHRKQGLYQAVYDHFQQRGDVFGPLAFGFPNVVASEIGQAKMGYEAQSGTMVLQRTGDQILGISEIPTTVTNEVPDDWRWYTPLTDGSRGITTYRSVAFLKWRFNPAQEKTFKFVTAGHPASPKGILIYQISSVRVKIYDVYYDGMDTLQALLAEVTGRHPGLPVIYGATDNSQTLLDLQNAFGFEFAQRGVLVTSVMTDGGIDMSTESTEYVRTSRELHCTFTDTDS